MSDSIYSLLTLSGTNISTSAFQDLTNDPIDVVEIDGNHFLMIGADASTGYLTAYVVTEFMGSLTVGTGTTLTTALYNSDSAYCDTDGSSGVVSWNLNTSSSHGNVESCFISILGTTITTLPSFTVMAGTCTAGDVTLTDTDKAIVSYNKDDGAGSFDKYLVVIDATGVGTPLLYGTNFFLGKAIAPTSTYAIVFDGSIYEISISGYSLSITSTTVVTANTPLDIKQLSASTALLSYDDGTTSYIRYISFSMSLSEKILSLSTPFFGGTEFWATIWRDGILYLQQRDTSTGLVLSELSLGSATEAQVAAKTYITYVFAADEDSLVVFGRMNAPQGLSSPTHVMYTNDSGVSWTETVSDWGSDVCADLAVNRYGELIAVRVDATTGKSEVYTGSADALQFATAMDFDYGVEYGGLSIDSTTAAIVASGTSESSSGVIIERLQRPYTTTHDITLGRSTAGIKRVDAT